MTLDVYNHLLHNHVVFCNPEMAQNSAIFKYVKHYHTINGSISALKYSVSNIKLSQDYFMLVIKKDTYKFENS